MNVQAMAIGFMGHAFLLLTVSSIQVFSGCTCAAALLRLFGLLFGLDWFWGLPYKWEQMNAAIRELASCSL